MISHLFSPGKSQQSNDRKVLCSDLGGISRCWQKRPFKNKSFQNQTGHTECLMLQLHTRELALTHRTFKAGWHASPWEWHFWTHLCLNRLIPFSLHWGIQSASLIYKGAAAECRSSDFKKRVNECWTQVLSMHTKAPTPLSEVRINPVLLLMTWQVDTEVWTGSINKTCCCALWISLQCFLTHANIWEVCWSCPT